MMQQMLDIEGRPALVTFMDEMFVPVDDPDEAALVKAQFTDRAGGVVFLVPQAKEFDESKHPREPAGSPTGGQFTSGGGGGPGGEAKPAEEKPPSVSTKAKKKTEAKDFSEDKIELDSGTIANKEKQEKFLNRWNSGIDIDPGEFKKQFLGGLPGTMSIYYRDAEDTMDISGRIEDANGNVIADYTREIRFRQGVPDSAYSSYFKMKKAEQGGGVGKTMLKANVDMYQKIGAKKLSVSANIDVGGYAWAKYGYVPTPGSWSALRSIIGERIDKLQGRSARASGGGGDTYTPDEWAAMGEEDHERIFRAWANSTRSEFIDFEIESWRDSGQPLEDAKNELAGNYSPDAEWAQAALERVREKREDAGKPPIPFTDAQLLEAITVEEYQSRYGDGRDDPDISFDDDKLTAPTGYDPAQQTLPLPGVEPLEPHEMLTEDMRKDLDKALVRAFNNEAEAKAADMPTPDWIGQEVEERQGEYWDSMDEGGRYEWAERNGELPEYPIEEEDEDDEAPEPQAPITPADETPLEAVRKLAQSSDPKALWAIADSKYGKDLLLNTNWSGVIDFSDKQTMDRFNAYVGRKK